MPLKTKPRKLMLIGSFSVSRNAITSALIIGAKWPEYEMRGVIKFQLLAIEVQSIKKLKLKIINTWYHQALSGICTIHLNRED